MYSIRGSRVQYSLFGESHGPAIGMTIHGFPEGIVIDQEAIDAALARRRTGGAFASQRQETDAVVWLSGTKPIDSAYSDVGSDSGNSPARLSTTGAPLTFVIYNQDQRPKDYAQHARVVRPSHADYPAHVRYQGHNDERGGGMFSGRLTAVYVVAGTLCRQLLAAQGILLKAHIDKLGRLSIAEDAMDAANAVDATHAVDAVTVAATDRRSWLESLKPQWRELVNAVLQEAQQAGDSIGGRVSLRVDGLPVGIGEPQLHSLESELSSWLFSIPGAKAVGFGLAEAFASAKGSQVNDSAAIVDGRVVHRTNHNGGVFGGLTNGMPLQLQVTFKPTPSIYKPQDSVDVLSMTEQTLEIKGRHDPAFVIRTPVVVESVVAMGLFDLMRFRFWP